MKRPKPRRGTEVQQRDRKEEDDQHCKPEIEDNNDPSEGICTHPPQARRGHENKANPTRSDACTLRAVHNKRKKERNKHEQSETTSECTTSRLSMSMKMMRKSKTTENPTAWSINQTQGVKMSKTTETNSEP